MFSGGENRECPLFCRRHVVLVHGLWMNGLEFSVLEHRLRHEHGFDVRTFSYPTHAWRCGADLPRAR